MINSLVSVIMTAVILVTSLFYTGLDNGKTENEYSILKNKSIATDLSGDASSSDNFIEIQFDEPVSFNTVVLKEKNMKITSFSISVRNENGDYIKAYEQERIGEYRYCLLGDFKSDAVRITVNSCEGNAFKLKDVDVLNVTENKNEDFRVTAYVVCSSFDYSVDADKMNSITDVIIFGAARFNELGEIYFDSINGKSGSVVMNEIARVFRNANPDIRIYCNILGPDGSSADNKEELHSQAFNGYGDILAENIVKLVEDNNLDGIFFDYEYPYKLKSRNDFSKFLVKLDGIMGDYEIGAALACWNCKLTYGAIQALDRVEIMAYDDMSISRQHSEFASEGGILSIEYFEKYGYDLSKCDLGLPFYGRTHGGEEAWPSYAQIACDLEGPFTNVVDKSYLYGGTYDDGLSTSFNGVQMIKDKTAFANDYGLGGVMVWHYSCDVAYESEYSLFKAIQASLNTRS